MVCPNDAHNSTMAETTRTWSRVRRRRPRVLDGARGREVSLQSLVLHQSSNRVALAHVYNMAWRVPSAQSFTPLRWLMTSAALASRRVETQHRQLLLDVAASRFLSLLRGRVWWTCPRGQRLGRVPTSLGGLSVLARLTSHVFRLCG